MTCTDFIKNQKEDFFYNLVDENFVSMADTEGLYAFMLNWITQLCTVRLLKSQTKKVFGRINEVHPKNVIYVEHWLMRALQNDKTCIHAYNALAQRINRKSEGILPYPVKAVNESELLELIQCEQKPEAIAVHEYSPIFRLDPKLMEEIFEHCEDIIDCEQEVFFRQLKQPIFRNWRLKQSTKCSIWFINCRQKWVKNGTKKLSLQWDGRRVNVAVTVVDLIPNTGQND